MKIKSLILAAVAASFAFSPAMAENQEIKPIADVGGQRLGQLDCKIEGGWGLLLGSSKKAACVFVKTDGTTEIYEGSLNKLGLDIGKTQEAYMTWAVLAKEGYALEPAALNGSYSGVSAEVSLGIGLGTNALIGGAGTKIGLQPISVQDNSGLNLAVGLASLKLEAVSN